VLRAAVAVQWLRLDEAQRALAPGTPVNDCSGAQLPVSSDEARHDAAARTGGGRTASSGVGAGKTWLPRG
jgi:hypothetical protein